MLRTLNLLLGIAPDESMRSAFTAQSAEPNPGRSQGDLATPKRDPRATPHCGSTYGSTSITTIADSALASFVQSARRNARHFHLRPCTS